MIEFSFENFKFIVFIHPKLTFSPVTVGLGGVYDKGLKGNLRIGVLF